VTQSEWDMVEFDTGSYGSGRAAADAGGHVAGAVCVLIGGRTRGAAGHSAAVRPRAGRHVGGGPAGGAAGPWPSDSHGSPTRGGHRQQQRQRPELRLRRESGPLRSGHRPAGRRCTYACHLLADMHRLCHVSPPIAVRPILLTVVGCAVLCKLRSSSVSHERRLQSKVGWCRQCYPCSRPPTNTCSATT
jgi:hypothetical protein